MCQTSNILLRPGPQNNARLKPVRGAKKFAGPCFRQTERHLYLASEKIRYQGEENDRTVFESSSPEWFREDILSNPGNLQCFPKMSRQNVKLTVDTYFRRWVSVVWLLVTDLKRTESFDRRHTPMNLTKGRKALSRKVDAIAKRDSAIKTHYFFSFWWKVIALFHFGLWFYLLSLLPWSNLVSYCQATNCAPRLGLFPFAFSQQSKKNVVATLQATKSYFNQDCRLQLQFKLFMRILAEKLRWFVTILTEQQFCKLNIYFLSDFTDFSKIISLIKLLWPILLSLATA